VTHKAPQENPSNYCENLGHLLDFRHAIFQIVIAKQLDEQYPTDAGEQLNN